MNASYEHAKASLVSNLVGGVPGLTLAENLNLLTIFGVNLEQEINQALEGLTDSPYFMEESTRAVSRLKKIASESNLALCKAYGESIGQGNLWPRKLATRTVVKAFGQYGVSVATTSAKVGEDGQTAASIRFTYRTLEDLIAQYRKTMEKTPSKISLPDTLGQWTGENPADKLQAVELQLNKILSENETLQYNAASNEEFHREMKGKQLFYEEQTREIKYLHEALSLALQGRDEAQARVRELEALLEANPAPAARKTRKALQV